MPKRSRRFQAHLANLKRDHFYLPDEAMKMTQDFANAKFDETIEIHLRMGVDPRHAGANYITFIGQVKFEVRKFTFEYHLSFIILLSALLTGPSTYARLTFVHIHLPANHYHYYVKVS